MTTCNATAKRRKSFPMSPQGQALLEKGREEGSMVTLGGKVVVPDMEGNAKQLAAKVVTAKIKARLVEERKRRLDSYVYGWLHSLFEQAYNATLHGQPPLKILLVTSINAALSSLGLPVSFLWAWTLLWVGKQTREDRAAHCLNCSARKKDPVTREDYCNAENDGRGCGCWMNRRWFPAFLRNKRRARNWSCPRAYWSPFSVVQLTVHLEEEKSNGD